MSLFICMNCGIVPELNVYQAENVDTMATSCVCRKCKTAVVKHKAPLFTKDQVFLDIETLDLAITAVIPQIGAVVVNRYGRIIDKLSIDIDLNQPGRTISSDTVSFWMKQSDEARKAVFCGDNRVPLAEALAVLNERLGKYDAEFWGNPALFDLGKIQHAATSLGYEVPWAWYNTRCYHEFKRGYKHELKLTNHAGVYHNAVDEAEQLLNRVAVQLVFGAKK